MADREPQPPQPINIVILNPQAINRQGHEALLARYEKFAVIKSTGSPTDALQFLTDTEEVVHVVLLAGVAAFAEFSRANRTAVIRTIQQIHPDGIVVLSSVLNDNEAEEDELLRAMKGGAAGYIPSTAEPKDFLETLEQVAKRQYTINQQVLDRPALAARVLDELRKPSRELPVGLGTALSNREIQILERAAAGRSNKQIATELGISDQTVKNHMSSIMRKLNVSDRTHAVVTAMRLNLLEQPRGDEA